MLSIISLKSVHRPTLREANPLCQARPKSQGNQRSALSQAGRIPIHTKRFHSRSTFPKLRIHHILRTMALHHLARRDTADAAAPKEVANYAPLLLWSIWVVTVVSGLFLGLRVYCKLTRHRAMWWDDWILVLSWVSHCLTLRRRNG